MPSKEAWTEFFATLFMYELFTFIATTGGSVLSYASDGEWPPLWFPVAMMTMGTGLGIVGGIIDARSKTSQRPL